MRLKEKKLKHKLDNYNCFLENNFLVKKIKRKNTRLENLVIVYQNR